MQIADIVERLVQDDFLFIESAQAIDLLSAIVAAPIGSDEVFLNSWSRLEEDQYMADGGKYRKRRHAVYAILNPIQDRV
ncbi:MAG: 2OG-Fe dioxygenase family protein, partial [Gammaproteobacteria bacterium]|nr:2OG-Fe dioxygenase family protein [Gammaproteobacteria bacterium]